jgi:TRAP-type C4-dicarboxylate transport system substrate-binding protein
MRSLWDELVGRARRTVIDAGVQVASLDKRAFRSAVQRLLARYLRDPEIKRLYDMLGKAA